MHNFTFVNQFKKALLFAGIFSLFFLGNVLGQQDNAPIQFPTNGFEIDGDLTPLSMPSPDTGGDWVQSNGNPAGSFVFNAD